MVAEAKAAAGAGLFARVGLLVGAKAGLSRQGCVFFVISCRKFRRQLEEGATLCRQEVGWVGGSHPM
jgi:hypothetical protein